MHYAWKIFDLVVDKGMKKILVVAGDFVYPPNHGGRVDIWNRILVLHEMGFWIHLVCTVKTNPDTSYISIVKEKVQRLDLVPRKNRILDMFCRRPLQMASRRALKNVELEREYDFLLLEGTYVWDILSNPGLNTKKLVLRMHNNESVYFHALADSENSFLHKLYYWTESQKFKKMDSEIIQKVPNILFISYAEKNDYEKRYSNLHSCFLPASVKLDFKHRERDNHTALLIASFFMKNNREAITFYLEKVHPLIKISDYQILIAGNSRGQSIAWLNNLSQKYKNVQIYDSPIDLQPLYEHASVFINSMLHGAGVKLKTINAVVEGLPVVSTTTGNEGTGLCPDRDILVADQASELASAIEDLLKNKKKADDIVSNAQSYIQEHYDQRKVLEEYFCEFED